ncbi:MAG: SIMPL domain-containing protein [archaeon]|jgi:hypothetical protein|nr:SIMPL domain-containing protein [archaeon]
METSIKITLIITVAILAIAGAAGLLYWKTANPAETVSVSGSSVIKATPDIVTVYFTVQTSGATAEEAKDNNSEIVDEVITNLVKLGLERKDIATENYNVYPDYDWINGRQVSRGYKATHSIKVELSAAKMDKVGSVIDAGVEGGATINYINFELSKDTENAYKAQALKEATEDARLKADSMASGLGKSVSGIKSVSAVDFGYYPWRVYGAEGAIADVAMAKEAVATNIQPGEREVNAQVNVVFELK